MNVLISIVVPAFEEAENIEPLAARIHETLSREIVDYELIIVDDGSRDQTWSAIKTAAGKNLRVKGLRLVRNFGQQNALLAGLAGSIGDAVITMDGDLQHSPELLPAMISAWRNGALVVGTRRAHASSGDWFKRNSSKIFYRMFSSLTGVHTRPGSSDFRLLDRSVVQPLLAFRGGHGFLRGAVNWLGYPTVTLEYEVGTRNSGRSKYSTWRMLKFAVTAIATFTTRPLYIGIWIGAILALFSFIELAFVVFQHARGVTVPGWASLVGIVSLLFGCQFALLGILGLYIARIHAFAQLPPSYIVAESTKSERNADPPGSPESPSR